jgi:hypothetical protein
MGLGSGALASITRSYPLSSETSPPGIAPFRNHIHGRAFMTSYLRKHNAGIIAMIAPE